MEEPVSIETEQNKNKCLQNKEEFPQNVSQKIIEELINSETEQNNKSECLQNKDLLQKENVRAKKRYRYQQDLENNRAKKRHRYKQDLKNSRAKQMQQYKKDLKNNRAKQMQQYKKDLDNNRAKQMQRYKKDLDNNRAKKRRLYEQDLNNNRARKRQRYEQDIHNNRTKKRIRYLKNAQYECDRQKVYCDRKWLYNKQYYEKKKLKSNFVKKNCDVAKTIIKKYKKFWSRDCIKFHNPVVIEKISKKLDIKNQIEKRLEAEKIVRWCMHIRNNYVRNMYKILITLKKKSEVCLSLATKCSTTCILW